MNLNDLGKITIFSSQNPLKKFIDRMKSNDVKFSINTHPWDNVKISRLIESILIQLPIASFYFELTNDKYTIIDGNHRLNAIKKFIIDMDVELVDLEYLADLNGKKYNDLSRSHQRRINEFPISTCVFSHNNMSIEVRDAIYGRLNPKFQ